MIPLTAIILTILLANLLSPYFEKEIKIQVAGNNYRVNHALYYFLLMFPLYFIAAFQYANANDYYNYSVMFNEIRQGMRSISEPIIYAIFKGTASLNLSFQFVYIFIYALIFCVLYKCLKDYSKNFAMSLIIYITLFYSLAMFQIRQLLAVVISFYAYRYIAQRKSIPYICFIIAACMCHLSAIIMIPAYFLFRYKIRLTDYGLFAGGLIVAGIIAKRFLPVLIANFFPSRINWYNNYQSSQINKWEIILLALIIVLIIIYAKSICEDSLNRIFIHAFLIYILLFFLGRWIPEVLRWGYYYFFPIVALLPNCLAAERNVRYQKFYSFLVMLFLITYMFLRYINQIKQLSLIFI